MPLFFVSSSYRVVIELSNNFQLDLRNTEFGNLIGFDKKIVTITEYSARLPNITNNIDSINTNCDIITDSILDGRFTNTLAVIPTSGIRASYPFKFEPLRSLFNPVSKNNISEMKITVTDDPINLNGINWDMSLILRSTLM